jgi:hypothetical protein
LRHARSASHRVDDEVGRQRLSAVGAHAGDAARPRQEPSDARAAPHGEPGLDIGRAGNDLLQHRAADMQRDEALVTRPRGAIGDRRRHVHQPVLAHGAGLVQHGADVGQRVVEDLAAARLEAVGLPELRHAAALPVVPRSERGIRHRRRVALEQRHLVVVAGEHEPGGKPAHAAAEDEDPSHAPWTRTVRRVFPALF